MKEHVKLVKRHEFMKELNQNFETFRIKIKTQKRIRNKRKNFRNEYEIKWNMRTNKHKKQWPIKTGEVKGKKMFH